MNEHIVLVGCTRTKLRHQAPARDLYTGEWFKAAKRVAELYGTHWYILSGKHGLLSPEALLEPYDLRLAEQSTEYQQAWSARVLERLKQLHPQLEAATVIADVEYSQLVVARLTGAGTKIYDPLRDMSREQQRTWLAERAEPGLRGNHLDEFYDLLTRVEHASGPAMRLREASASAAPPPRGLYLFSEDGETRWLSETSRIVRVGTHAVSLGSKSTLWTRLRAHRGNEDQRGNHRASIFRLHVGAALISRDSIAAGISQWGIGQSGSSTIRADESDIERQVSAYIGALRIQWLGVLDEPSSASDRAYLERNSIALICGTPGPLDPPRTTWLGMFSPNATIRRSGLWNLDHVGAAYDPRFIAVFREYILRLERGESPPDTSIAPPDWIAHKGKRQPVDQIPLTLDPSDDAE